MAILLKVRNSQTFIETMYHIIGDNDHGNSSDASWIIEKFSNSTYITYYSPQGERKKKAWFRVCPDDIRKAFNGSKGTAYNLIFRLHGSRNNDMTKDLYSFYHSKFIEFILQHLLDDLKEMSITTTTEDIQFLDKFKNYDWR